LKFNPLLYETGYENRLGGNIKGGANYNIDDQNNACKFRILFQTTFFNAVYPKTMLPRCGREFS
jgi:hypothetical protein